MDNISPEEEATKEAEYATNFGRMLHYKDKPPMTLWDASLVIVAKREKEKLAKKWNLPQK